MDSIRSYGSQGLAYAKSNPITTVALIAAFVMAVLAIVVIFNVRKVPDSAIADEETRKKLVNAKRAALGMAVLAVLGAIAALIKHFRK